MFFLYVRNKISKVLFCGHPIWYCTRGFSRKNVFFLYLTNKVSKLVFRGHPYLNFPTKAKRAAVTAIYKSDDKTV